MGDVYVWYGHGSDRCDPVTHQVIRTPVPDDCVVIQRGLCGLPTFASFTQIHAPFENPANLPALQRADPAELKGILAMDVARHSPDSAEPFVKTIAASMVSLLHDMDRGDSIVIFPSGIHSVPFKVNSRPTFQWEWADGPIPTESFVRVYEDSVYPTQDMVMALLAAAGLSESITREQYATLAQTLRLIVPFDRMIELFPGVHYHLICRSVGKDCVEAAIANRSASGFAHGKSKGAIDDFTVATIAEAYMTRDYAVEAAHLPHDKFAALVDQILAKPGVECKNGNNVLLLVVGVMQLVENPEEYEQEYLKAYALCFSPEAVADGRGDNAFAGLVKRIKASKQGGALGPAKYYRGLSTRRKSQRHREITRRAKMSWKDPKAYKPFATDKGTQRRPSSYSSRFHTKYPGVTGLPAIAKATHVPLGTLQTVYNRGMAAWRTGHRPGASQAAWGMARVHSFVLHGKTWRTADKDLAGK